MRLILNFIIFGLIFYAIWYFFPDAFSKLVEWAGDIFNYIASLVNKVKHHVNNAPAEPEKTHALLQYLNFWL